MTNETSAGSEVLSRTFFALDDNGGGDGNNTTAFASPSHGANMTAAGWPVGTPSDPAQEQLPRPELLSQPTHILVLFTTAYTLVFMLAVINNSLVVTVIYQNRNMRTVTNYFLANLAVADIMVSIVVLPITLLTNIFKEWLFSEFLCKAVPYMQAVVVSASVNTLAAVALERYFAIFYSHVTMINPRKAFIIIAVIWTIPMCIHIPWPLNYHLQEFNVSGTRTKACYMQFEDTAFEKGFFLGVVFLTCYLIPLACICVFYSLIGLKVWGRSVAGLRGSKAERNIQRSKIRIVSMLITVAIFFTVSWLPLYSIRMYILFGPKMVGEVRNVVLKIIFPMAQWMGSANSCVNPFIYCFFSEQFRKGILGILQIVSSCCGKWRHRGMSLVDAEPDETDNALTDAPTRRLGPCQKLMTATTSIA